MKLIQACNVNDAYYKGLKYLRESGEIQPSRAGEVLVSPIPVVTEYSRPRERVLFDARRDANPFLHLMESLWMLEGRNDARWLDQFVKDFSSRFAEEDGIQHGAYGYRWRKAFGFDQLNAVVDKLRKDHYDRQCVIQMWDCRADYIPTTDITFSIGAKDLTADWKDRPCNTHIYLRVRQVPDEMKTDDPDYVDNPETNTCLHMTVCCRSNDAIWGAYGANAVHFSVLQEYLAARIGVKQIRRLTTLRNAQ